MPDLATRVAAADDRLLRELTAITVASAALGAVSWAVGRRREVPDAVAFGRQLLGWTSVDALVAVVGAVRRTTPDGDDEARARARRLHRVTAVNAVLDVGYVAAAPVLARWWPHRRGDAGAVALSGAALLWLDVRHSRRFRRLARP